MVGAAVRECTSVSAFPIITELSPYITIYHYATQCVVEERDGNYQRFHMAWVSCLSRFHWSLFTLEMFHQESHFSDLNGSVSYADVCGYACALSLRDGMLFVEVVPCTAMFGSWLLSGCGGWGGYWQWVFRRVPKIILGNRERLSFRWLLATYSAWM